MKQTVNHPIDNKPIEIEIRYADDLERDATPEWRCYAWRNGNILGSGSGKTKDIAYQNMWNELTSVG